MEIEKLKQEHSVALENLNFQNTKYKTELEELSQFKSNKVILNFIYYFIYIIYIYIIFK